MTHRRPSKLVLATVIILGVTVAGPLAAPYAPSVAQPNSQFEGPSIEHLLGTDNLGRDTLSRFLWAANKSIAIALVSTFIATIIGSIIGLMSGTLKGAPERLIHSFSDVWLAFPGLILVLLLISLFGRADIIVALAMGLTYAPVVARLVRRATLQVYNEDFIAASAALGANWLWLVRKHALPNLARSIGTNSALVFSWSLLAVSGLEFVGLTGDTTITSLGQMINEGRAYVREAPILVIVPGAFIAIVVWVAQNWIDEL